MLHSFLLDTPQNTYFTSLINTFSQCKIHENTTKTTDLDLNRLVLRNQASTDAKQNTAILNVYTLAAIYRDETCRAKGAGVDSRNNRLSASTTTIDAHP